MASTVVCKAIPEIVSAAVQLVANLKECNVLIQALKDFLAKVDELKDVENETRNHVRNVIDELKVAVSKFYLFVQTVDDVFWYGHDNARRTRIKKGIKRGNYGDLLDFTDLLSLSLAEAKAYYLKSMQAFETVKTTSLDGAKHCRIKAQEAESKQRTTKAVGGTVAAGAIAAGTAGGIAASVVAGIFTFGIGAVVGLSLTAVGAIIAGAAVGTGVGVATHFVASDLQEVEALFSDLNKSFKDVYTSASTMLDDILIMEVALDAISSKLKTVKYAGNNHRVTENLLSEVERLFQRFSSCSNQSSQCRDALKEVTDKFKKS